MRIQRSETREAHRLESWNPETWPDWLRESLNWVMGWRDCGWVRLGDVIYMQGKTLASGLDVMGDGWVVLDD